MTKQFRKVELVLLALTVLIFICGVTSFYLLHITQTEKTNTFDQIQLLKVVAKDIVYHDEVLTMSARINILDKTPHWAQRYQQHSQLLEQALATAKLNQTSLHDLTEKLQNVNGSLIALEKKAFSYVENDQPQKAITALFGEKYLEQKDIYSDLINQILQSLADEEDRYRREYQYQQTLFQRLFIITVAAFLCLLAAIYTVKKIKDKQISMLILHDPLTSLLNRRAFDNKLNRELRRCAREQRYFALAILDVDHFKKYNDQYGHAAGDKVLSKIGEAMSLATQRASEYAFRIGGEEFAVITSTSDPKEAVKCTENILAKIQALSIPHNSNPPCKKVTISIGLATVSNGQNLTPNEIYVKADEALYEAKNAGRNRLKTIAL